MSTITENYVPSYEGQPISARYAWWVTQEFNHVNPNIDAYARLITSEYEKLVSGTIDIQQFALNTPTIKEEIPLNYIRNCIIQHYPN